MLLNLFPTLVETFEIKEKIDLTGREDFYETYNCSLHLDANPAFFKEIADCVRQYISHVGYTESQWDLHLVKSFWTNLKGEEHIALHNHSDAHISFVYYQQIDENEPQLLMQRPEGINDLNGALYIAGQQDNVYSSNYLKVEGKPGMLLVFPATLKHLTETLPSKNRVSVVGDFLMILRERTNITSGLQPVDTWQVY